MLKYVGEYDMAFSMIILGFLSINMQKEEEKIEIFYIKWTIAEIKLT